MALRVVADHLRAVAFAIADGQLPSNNKAGYVIRRILRRAVRYGYSFLGFRAPFLCDGVGPLIATMGSNYPELQAQQRLIESVIREEEAAFLRTLQAGLQLLQAELARCQREGRTQLEGSVAFTLYDTFGFPRDLTELMLREKGTAPSNINSYSTAPPSTPSRADKWATRAPSPRPTRSSPYSTPSRKITKACW